MRTKTWQRSAEQKIIAYSHAGRAGCVSLARCKQTGTMIGVYHNQQAGFDASDGQWSTVCEDHGSICNHDSLQLARQHARDPLGWCEVCQKKEQS